jgi:hypothetical protein
MVLSKSSQYIYKKMKNRSAGAEFIHADSHFHQLYDRPYKSKWEAYRTNTLEMQHSHSYGTNPRNSYNHAYFELLQPGNNILFYVQQ